MQQILVALAHKGEMQESASSSVETERTKEYMHVPINATIGEVFQLMLIRTGVSFLVPT